MKTKSIIAGIITGAVCLSMAAGCSNSTETGSSAKPEGSQSAVSEKPDTVEASAQDSAPEQDGYTLTVKDPGKNAEIKATFSNTMTGASQDITMEKTEESSDHFIFTCKGDTDKYNMVHFSYGDMVTKDAAFNKCVSGWELFEGELLPYDIKSDKKFELKYDTKTFNVSGLEKDVYIWTPDTSI